MSFSWQGYLEDTELFYGIYTNATLTGGYDMSYAYLMTSLCVFLSSLIILVYRWALSVVFVVTESKT